MMTIKQLPNILSISRIVLSLILLLLFNHPIAFVLLYFFIGITDVLDGYIARKYKVASALGARLDSIGDFVFYIVLTIYLFVVYNEILLVYWIPIALTFVLRICNILIGFLRHQRLTMLHTIANKVTGILVFIMPVMLILGLKEYLIPVIIMAFLASFEELIIILKSEKGKIDLNQKHL